MIGELPIRFIASTFVPAWALPHPIGSSIIWIVLITVICAPLAVRVDNKKTSE